MSNDDLLFISEIVGLSYLSYKCLCVVESAKSLEMWYYGHDILLVISLGSFWWDIIFHSSSAAWSRIWSWFMYFGAGAVIITCSCSKYNWCGVIYPSGFANCSFLSNEFVVVCCLVRLFFFLRLSFSFSFPIFLSHLFCWYSCHEWLADVFISWIFVLAWRLSILLHGVYLPICPLFGCSPVPCNSYCMWSIVNAWLPL